jgi:hypothetical protein
MRLAFFIIESQKKTNGTPVVVVLHRLEHFETLSIPCDGAGPAHREIMWIRESSAILKLANVTKRLIIMLILDHGHINNLLKHLCGSLNMDVLPPLLRKVIG